MSGLGPDALMPILMDTLAASIDHDTERLAAATKPLFYEGDEADRYAFLCGLLEVIAAGLPCRPGEGEFAALELDPGVDQEEATYGRILAAFVNDDRSMCIDLWAATITSDELSAGVLALAINEAGQTLERGRAAHQ